MKNFEKVNPKQSFPELEQDVLRFWNEHNIFQKSIENRADAEEFNFYDGPPFATGTPHYGHILAGAIKDVIPRYQTMKGKKVERKFGWDTHGLPIENIVEKKLEIKGKEDLEERVGIFTFNETCRKNVFGYVDDWEKIVNRMGRWVDMKNDYKTMDTDFMESVWWVFSELYKKGLIYEGHRVVPYSVGMSTPLSNFEVNQGYKDKQSKTVTVKFKVQDTEKKYLLAWTTTPWTLYANLGLAVGEDILYAEILDKESGETYILASDLVKNYYKNEDDYTLIREYKGTCLVGIKYEPIFDDFKVQLEDMQVDLGPGIELGKNSWSVVLGHHVTTENGTGIVHIAPAYGEDDSQIGQEKELGFVVHINDSGNTYNLLDEKKNGQFVFDFSENVITELKEKNASIHIGTINHSYPHCWRSGVPLIYRAISAWYVDVTAIKDMMIANNQQINWVPDDIKNGRMGKWLEGARDWNISRNRYWGSAIPVWQNEDKSQEVCIGSIEELYEHNKDYGQMTKIIFVRHGRTDYNEKGLFDYKDHAKLNESGKKQAEQIAKIFANEDISAIYSSPLSRCVDTITPLARAKNLEVVIKDAFIEINAPDLQDQAFSCKDFNWENGFGGGETIKEVHDRVSSELQKLIEKHPGETIVVCSHGDPTFLARMSLHSDIDYADKYSCGKYPENNPKKHPLEAMYGTEYVYTKNKKETTKFIISRHGRTDYNDKKIDDVENNSSLNATGEKQSKLLCEHLGEKHIDILFSSPFTRTQQTVAPLAEKKGLTVITDERISEIQSDNHGKNYIPFHGNFDKKLNGEKSESMREVYDRIKDFIEEVKEKYAGKTVMICTHGHPALIAQMILDNTPENELENAFNTGIMPQNNTENIQDMYFEREITVGAKAIAVDLHKHFVDEIYVKGEKAQKTKKVLGVHGWQSRGLKAGSENFWELTKNICEKNGIIFNVPNFDKSADTSYEVWKKQFDELDIRKNYDTIVAHSLGCPMSMEYILENKIKLQKLVLVAPSGIVGNKILRPIQDELNQDKKLLGEYVDEIIIIHSKDDDAPSAPFEYGKKLANELDAQFIEMDGYKHVFAGNGGKIIASLTKNGAPLKRIPEVLDCWFESGSMPYASKHFPFAEKIIFKNNFSISRHGLSEHNVLGVINGDPEQKDKYGLTDEGKNLVKEEAKNFEGEFDLIVTSPFRRARETAEIYQKHLGGEIIIDDRLAERHMPEFEGQTWDDMQKELEEGEKLHGSERIEGTLDGVERAFEALSEYNEKYEGKNILFVSHGMISSALPLYIKGKSLDGYQTVEKGKIHPLENNFKFPADFIAEGLDQTRGWFYTLIILGTALFGQTPFLNCIVNGIILAEDGRKMSKSLKNYPDPELIFNKYGADAMRFYLLNSPVVEAQDFRFSESGVEEVVKKVILPLWNTYYFFTTYANIDGFIPPLQRGMSEVQGDFSAQNTNHPNPLSKEGKGQIYFVRHGETDNNKYKRVNGGESDVDINETGIAQAHETGKKLQKMGIKFDKIISSPMQRAKHTAEIINSYLGNIEIEVKDETKERNYGDFGGKTFEEIAEAFNIENEYETIWNLVFGNSPETLKDFIVRNSEAIEKIREKEKGKNILIVGHSGNFRAIMSEKNPDISVEDFSKLPIPKNADFFKISEKKSNKLDTWLISELNELTKEVTTGFDNFKLRDAGDPVVKFMDNLTNWYIRRSRKRFWKSENDGDKIEAYETLYFVLVELTKIIAPFMPFIAEHIYKNMTGNTSVHLADFPSYDESLIDSKLNADMDKVQKIITLGLAWRANQRIRVRQPLQSLTITEEFSDYYKDILKEELNVKEVLVVDGEKLAKKICKPNGRTIGPKFGKDVKFIITEAKAGNFEELEDGRVQVGNFVLEPEDFELVYEAGDSEKLIEAGFGMVIAMDAQITPELRAEGHARDLVRHIQEARKEADFNVDDRISLELSTESEELKKAINDFKKYIETETLSSFEDHLEKNDFEKEVELEDMKIKIRVKK